jgi:TolB-like protein/DNA-binding winged helix-turn-helix (wHTH) protein/Flp pilus assembly protein TadD
MPQHVRQVLRFSSFEVDLKAGELRKEGRRRRLQEKPFRVLEALLEHPGDVVTREELRQRLWPSDTFVDFDNGLNNSVNKVRTALGDSASAPLFIETVGRRGYRFVGTIQLPDEPVGPVSLDLVETSVGESQPLSRDHSRWRIAVIGSVAAAILVTTALVRSSRESSATVPTVSSLAVLPLQSLSDDAEQEYFSDGMTDALITHLAGIRALRVISRQSTIRLKKTDKPMPEIGRELGVDAIVEGTVLRTGNRVRITAQLVHAPTDRHLWSQEYERDLSDVIQLQSDIARAVAREIHVALRPEEASRLDSIAKVAPAAYDAYLRGRYLWNRRTEEGLRRSLDYFAQAVALDPKFAAAHASMAETYGPLGYMGFVPPHESTPQMKAAALKALELDQNLAEGWTALGACAAFHEWEWAAAEKYFKRALEANPNYATTYMWYGLLLENTGRQDENLAMRRRAIALNPLSPAAGAALGSALAHAGRLPEAVRQLRSVLELEPTFGQAHSFLGLAHLMSGTVNEAIAEFELVARDGSLGHAYASAGRTAEARAVLTELREASRERYVSPYEFALVLIGLGDRNGALDWLERAYDTRAVKLSIVKIDPRFKALQQEARFRALLSRMNLG